MAAAIRMYVGPESVVAIFGNRSFPVYTALMSVLLAGKGFVPLHIDFPPVRNSTIVSRSEATVVVVCREAIDDLAAVLALVDKDLAIIGADIDDFGTLNQQFPQHRFVGVNEGSITESYPISPDSIAYLLFTSGTTGSPKGVPISHRNLKSYLDGFRGIYPLEPTDRVSQTFDLVFDLSVHDMLVTWLSGACLCPVPRNAVIAPGKFIRERKLTVWFSVPSTAMFMRKLHMLNPGTYPDLRLSLFCGEALPIEVAQTWSRAAPNSAVVNLYGPTEATISITHFRWDTGRQSTDSRTGLVPIGLPFPTQHALVWDLERNCAVEGPGQGEILLGGSQISDGYWRAPELTRASFIAIAGAAMPVYYRTGDLVERDSAGCLHFVGRLDEQIKIHSYRVELVEVDAGLRKAANTELAVAVAFPMEYGVAKGLVGFICDSGKYDEHVIIEKCRTFLPSYMVPQRIVFVETFPRNVNGKIDRKALARSLAGSR
jgi:amino acid adenylation domain-containing protein